MKTYALMSRASLCRTGRRGFTMVELLVVLGIIAILASLLLPSIIHAMATAGLTNCIGNLRQMGQAMTSYHKDFDFWLVCGGAKTAIASTESRALDAASGPFLEPPADYDLGYEACRKGDFPFWYAAVAPYVNPKATMENAIRSYCLREGKNPGEVKEQAFHIEQARLCMLYTCPSKKQSPLGYGYNVAAPYGESIIYPRRRKVDSTTPAEWKEDYPNNCSTTGGRPADEFCWPWSSGDGRVTTPSGYMKYPCYMGNQPGPVPILWFGQSVPFGVLTAPGQQIAVCDTGLVTNDPPYAYSGVDWVRPVGPGVNVEGQVPATEWVEHPSGWAATNWKGYTRFPLCSFYTGRGEDWPASPGIQLRGRQKNYEWHTPDKSGMEYDDYNRAWRPVPRHNGRTACLFFDGRAAPVNIMDIVSYEWGDRLCMFDNRPANRPPAPKVQAPTQLYTTVGSVTIPAWLPPRGSDALPK